MYKLLNFICKIINKLNLHEKPFIAINDFKHSMINKHLKWYFLKSFKYVQNTSFKDEKYSKNINNKNIWVFWYQGYYNMPYIVKKCFQSIKRNANGHKVILITKNNIKNYVNIPKYIYMKVNSGKINLTKLSDILRFELLKTWGGLWVDSTIYCTSSIKDNAFINIYTSRGCINKTHFFISFGRWTGFLIGGDKGNKLFEFIDHFLLIYFKYNDTPIDYFLVDYALDFAYQNNIGNFKTYISKEHNNVHINSLQPLLNKKYSYSYYKYLTKDTNMFKLTYKKKLFNLHDTFYDMIKREKI